MTALGTAYVQGAPAAKVVTMDLQPTDGVRIDSGIIIPTSGGSAPTVPTSGITWPRTR